MTEYEFRVCPRDATPILAIPTSPPETGDHIDGRYLLKEQISEGGTSIVFAAEDIFDGVQAAVKVMRTELLEVPSLVRHFFDEALFNQKIQHLGVLPIRDFGLSQGGHHFLAMELMEGERFDKAIRSRRAEHQAFEFGHVINLARQILNILDAVHAEGVVHLDLKPENLLLLEGQRVMLFDFGSALQIGTTLPPEVPFMGTPSYMAPEWIQERKAEAAADLYALGLMLSEALTGQTVFDDPDPQVVLTRQINEDFPYERIASACAANFRGRFLWFLSHMVAKDPAERFEGAREALAFLEEQLVVQPVPLPRTRSKTEQMTALKDHDEQVRKLVAGRARDARAQGQDGSVSMREIALLHLNIKARDTGRVRADMSSVIDAWRDRVEFDGAVVVEDSGDVLRFVFGWEKPLDRLSVVRFMHALFTSLHSPLAPRTTIPFSIGVGLASGPIYCHEEEEEGLVSMLSQAPAAIASRLASAVQGNAVVANDDFVEALGESVEVRRLFNTTVREATGVEPVYLLRGTRKV